MAMLEISTAIGCPMRCTYCPQDTIQRAYHGPRLMPLIVFATALSRTPADVPVSFAGFAEPYLNRSCSDMILLAHRQKRRILVYTTGIGMSDVDVDVLIRVRPETLVLHLPDSAGEMKADVTPAYAARMRRLADNVASDCVCYGEMHPMLEHIRSRRRFDPLHSRAGNVTHLAQVRHRGPLRCKASPKLEDNVLLPDGSLVVCCNDWGMEHNVGSLLEQTWHEIHQAEPIERLRESMRIGADCRCQSCEFAVQR